jgi:prepilin-type N-terminal cleavage/methylation domain-containing protein
MWRSLNMVGWALPTNESRLCQMVGGAHPTPDPPRRSRGRSFMPSISAISKRSGFTLVEMLVAMAITLVMMAAVVTLFANISGSVRNRRATAEMSGQLRHVRNVLQQDLQGATCPGLTWQRPESNHGYIELIEGQYSDRNPTSMVRDSNGDGFLDTSDIDPATSLLPRNNLVPDLNNDGRLTAAEIEAHFESPASLAPGGIGDYDDILMLTVRNEEEPFVGRMPRVHLSNSINLLPFADWDYDTTESPLAEIVWFAIENPTESERAGNFFGEPGMRTIYRRTLLIAPWLNPYQTVANPSGVFTIPSGGAFKAEPGLLRILSDSINQARLEEAIAAVIAFQDRYDLSVRLEWDHNIQRWKIMANTLGDLTKRQNRFGHFGYFHGTGGATPARRIYPHAAISWGSGYKGDEVATVVDDEVGGPNNAEIIANQDANKSVVSYSIKNRGAGYRTRPFVFLAEDCSAPATGQAMLNDNGEVVRVVHGPVPLWGPRRGQDVMMTSALAFDLRVYDPGAPLFGVRQDPTDPNSQVSVVMSPSDAGYTRAYLHADNNGPNGIGASANLYPFSGQGAYVDMGYGFNMLASPPRFASQSAATPWFFYNRDLRDVYGNQLAPGYSVYDTWSFHYENNGVNEDNDEVEVGTGPTWQLNDRDADGTQSIDEGTNGLDDFGHYINAGPPQRIDTDIRLGPDDSGERETAPPYDKPLRGVQVLMRVYEPDSRGIRQVRVNQHFMPE